MRHEQRLFCRDAQCARQTLATRPPTSRLPIQRGLPTVPFARGIFLPRRFARDSDLQGLPVEPCDRPVRSHTASREKESKNGMQPFPFYRNNIVWLKRKR